MTQQDREPGMYLNTLAYRCTPKLVGDAAVYVRHFDSETEKLWSDFSRQCARRYGDDAAQAPYSIATTVLSTLSGGYVYFDPDFRGPFLASREPLDSELLRQVFTLTHALALGEKIDTIDLTMAPELAKRIAASPEHRYALADHLKPVDGTQPNAPGWVYRTVAWDLSRRMAAKPWAISDGREIALRPDTTGGLVALEEPWQNEQGGRYALSRTALRLKTLPNIASPVLLVSSRVTRISSSLIFSKTALAVQPGSGRPLLEVSLNGRGAARTVNRLALEALGRLEMDYSILRTIDQRSRREQELLKAAREEKKPAAFPREHPGQVWPVLPKSYSFPIGTGTGMQHLRLLYGHVAEAFGDVAVPLTMREAPMTLPHRPTDPERVTKKELERRKEEREKSESKEPLRARGSAVPTPESIFSAVEAAGFKKLRIACLWYRDETRLRMLDTLCKTYGIDPTGLDPHDGQEFSLHGDQITAVLHLATDFLKPGGPDGRREALAQTGASLVSGDGILVGAWCETEKPEAVDEQNGADADSRDGKLLTRSLLAGLGVPTQYILGKNDKGIVMPKAKDHPAEMALLDLYRSLGVIDDRIANALEPETFDYPVHRVAQVGVHVRQQNRRKGENGPPKVVITASALIPPAHVGGAWSMLGWSSTRPQWQPYRSAQPAFHAAAYPQENGDKKTHRQRWDDAAEAVELALGDLAEELDGVPYTVTVDGLACRRMWEGLQNMNQGASRTPRFSRYWLPGSSLSSDERPRSVIRINIADEEVPPPVSTTRVLKGQAGATTDGETTRMLYQVEVDFGAPVWILCNVPRAYDGDGAGRLGSKYTRWDAKRSVHSEKKEERRKGEMPQNWYSMTATEIYPLACAEGVSAEVLAVATAKLCHQTLFWSDRARFPVPLHAARQMDLDHPQYRRTAPPEEKPAAEPGSDGEASEQ
ncbi:RNaseH domain-containing protein [Streptomyces sp. NPDC005181]|uniref:RNaseH domain-containing protein n=1 Tax=Streptomyces sp. NPDC005181 TaxID=3156869 RepID=UPI0033B034CB